MKLGFHRKKKLLAPFLKQAQWSCSILRLIVWNYYLHISLEFSFRLFWIFLWGQTFILNINVTLSCNVYICFTCILSWLSFSFHIFWILSMINSKVTFKNNYNCYLNKYYLNDLKLSRIHLNFFLSWSHSSCNLLDFCSLAKPTLYTKQHFIICYHNFSEIFCFLNPALEYIY